MSNDHSANGAPEAALVGSLSTFSLSDVLTLLATTRQSGELQVVDETLDGKLWLVDGQLSNAHVGAATTIGQAVFDLACVSAGSFYFTPGIISSSGQPAVPVEAVLNEVRPQVDEWKQIRMVIPLDAEVLLAASPPGGDIQIRADQWSVLTTVGSGGNSVRQVLDRIGGDQVVGLRTLRDLHDAGLIELREGPSSSLGTPSTAAPAHRIARRSRTDLEGLSTEAESVEAESVEAGPAESVPEVATSGSDQPPSAPPLEHAAIWEDRAVGNLAEVTIMPPPIATDPWAPTAHSPGTTSNGTGDNGAA